MKRFREGQTVQERCREGVHDPSGSSLIWPRLARRASRLTVLALAVCWPAFVLAQNLGEIRGMGFAPVTEEYPDVGGIYRAVTPDGALSIVAQIVEATPMPPDAVAVPYAGRYTLMLAKGTACPEALPDGLCALLADDPDGITWAGAGAFLERDDTSLAFVVGSGTFVTLQDTPEGAHPPVEFVNLVLDPGERPRLTLVGTLTGGLVGLPATREPHDAKGETLATLARLAVFARGQPTFDGPVLELSLDPLVDVRGENDPRPAPGEAARSAPAMRAVVGKGPGVIVDGRSHAGVRVGKRLGSQYALPLCEGDVIARVDGTPLNDPSILIDRLAAERAEAEEWTELALLRDGEPLVLKVPTPLNPHYTQGYYLRPSGSDATISCRSREEEERDRARRRESAEYENGKLLSTNATMRDPDLPFGEWHGVWKMPEGNGFEVSFAATHVGDVVHEVGFHVGLVGRECPEGMHEALCRGLVDDEAARVVPFRHQALVHGSTPERLYARFPALMEESRTGPSDGTADHWVDMIVRVSAEENGYRLQLGDKRSGTLLDVPIRWKAPIRECPPRCSPEILDLFVQEAQATQEKLSGMKAEIAALRTLADNLFDRDDGVTPHDFGIPFGPANGSSNLGMIDIFGANGTQSTDGFFP